MTTMADMVMNIATVAYVTESYRNYRHILITFEVCWWEQICECAIRRQIEPDVQGSL